MEERGIPLLLDCVQRDHREREGVNDGEKKKPSILFYLCWEFDSFDWLVLETKLRSLFAVSSSSSRFVFRDFGKGRW